jgi:DNA helicase-2/ATP-dependent DNA helicase PcrA
LLDESKGESFRLLAVTYTRKAAEELQRRVKAGVGPELWRVEADTIHAFAFNWLRRFGQPVGVPRDVIVYSDQADRLLVLRDFVAGLGIEAREDVLLKLLSHLDSPNAASGEFVPEVGMTISEIREAYYQSLESIGGIDFGAMLSKFTELLEIDPSVLKKFRRSFRHVLVDEGQDLTERQSALLRLLVGDDLNLFVVADERQSINRWAGGGIEWARALVGPSLAELNLMHNFRCANAILEVAHQVAAHFTSPPPRALMIEGAPQGHVRLSAAADEVDEARLVADWVSELVTSGLPSETIVPGESVKVEEEEVGIVARARFRLDKIRDELLARSIRVSMLTDSREVLETPEGRLFYSLLNLRINPSDRPARRRAAEELEGIFSQDVPIGDDGEPPSRILKLIQEKAPGSGLEWLTDRAVQLGSVEDLEHTLLRLDEGPFEGKVHDDLVTIAGWWKAYRAANREQDRSLHEFLRYASQVHQMRPEDPGVRMLTTHRSKGLEFRAVAVIGLTQGSFPDYRNLGSAALLDEERRAFYVAVTRSSRALLLTWPRTSISRFGTIRHNDPSQFLQETSLL